MDTQGPSATHSHSLIVSDSTVFLFLKNAPSSSREMKVGPTDSDQWPILYETRFLAVPVRPPVTPRFLRFLSRGRFNPANRVRNWVRVSAVFVVDTLEIQMLQV